VLGGYDSTRFESSSTLQVNLRDATAVSDPYQLAVNVSAITVAFDLDVSNDRSVYDTRNIPVYVESGLIVNIDPVMPQLWLPTSACVALESALGLQWDEST
jgi:hypothetical protein